MSGESTMCQSRRLEARNHYLNLIEPLNATSVDFVTGMHLSDAT